MLAAACGGGSKDAGGGGASTSAPRTAQRGNVDGTLALGQLAPQTGSLASISKSLTTPVRIAVDEINAAGGVNGKPVALAVADDGGGANAPVASASLDTLLGSKVDAILGPTASGTALELLQKLRTNGVLTCSGSTSAEELTAANSGGYYFRTAPPDRLQAIALARLVVAQGKHMPVIIVRDDGYGDAFTRPLQRELRRAGASPLGNAIKYTPKGGDFAKVAREAAKRHPDSIVAISLVDDGAELVNALYAADIGPNQLPLYAPDGMQSTTFHTTVNPTNPALVAGIAGTAPAAAPAGPETAFTAEMRKAGVAPIFSAHYYDCAILTALAAVQARSDDPAKMKAAFAKSLTGTTDCASFAACTKALADGKSIHYRGASSSFDHWNRIEPGQGTYDVWSYGAAGNVLTGTPAQQIPVP
ncbi:MAG: ABC transporter substrate-binding protein [Acidimicrobiia bacterium]